MDRWLAPEIITPATSELSLVEMTKPADVFSFAMLAVEMYTGLVPFIVKRKAEVLRAISEGERPGRPKRMADDVWKLVTRCWNPKPNRRPAIGDVEKRLQKVIGPPSKSISIANNRIVILWAQFPINQRRMKIGK